MSNTEATITALGRRFKVKKTNKNVRLSLEFLKDLSFKNKDLISKADSQKDLSKLDLGDTDQFTEMLDSTSDIANSALAVQNLPVSFVENVLGLDEKQLQKLDDLTPGETVTLATQIANKVTGSETDPKK